MPRWRRLNDTCYMPKLFISHAHFDQAFVCEVLLPELQRHGIDTWCSEEDILTSQQWDSKIFEGLRACDWVLVVNSEKALASKWVRNELIWAFDQRQGRIIPLLLRDCDIINHFPQLVGIQHLDVRSDPAPAFRKLAELVNATGTVPNVAHAQQRYDLPGLEGHTLTEQFYILSAPKKSDWIRDDVVRYGLPAMALAELVLAGKVMILPNRPHEDLKNVMFYIKDRTPHKDVILNAVLSKLIEHIDSRIPSLGSLALTRIIDHALLKREFAARRIIQEVDVRSFLGLLSDVRCVLVSPDQQKQVRLDFDKAFYSIKGEWPVELALMTVVAKNCDVLWEVCFPEGNPDHLYAKSQKNGLAALMDRLIEHNKEVTREQEDLDEDDDH
jgi:hypothetical protein